MGYGCHAPDPSPLRRGAGLPTDLSAGASAEAEALAQVGVTSLLSNRHFL